MKQQLIVAVVGAAVGLTSVAAWAIEPIPMPIQNVASAADSSYGTVTAPSSYGGVYYSDSGYSSGYGFGYATGYPESWHGNYYHLRWGRPVAIVAPSVATYQTEWGRGIGASTVTRINPQYNGPSYAWTLGGQTPGRFLPTPYWPTHTRQFGAHYIRGPW